jgi:hypothetical protein
LPWQTEAVSVAIKNSPEIPRSPTTGTLFGNT